MAFLKAVFLCLVSIITFALEKASLVWHYTTISNYSVDLFIVQIENPCKKVFGFSKLPCYYKLVKILWNMGNAVNVFCLWYGIFSFSTIIINGENIAS